MLGQQIASGIVFKGEWPGAIIHLRQLTVLVIAELDFTAIGQGFFKQPPHGVSLIAGDQLGFLLAKLDLLAQMTVEVVAVSGGATIKAGFPRDQAIGEVVNAMLLAMLVLNLAQEELGIVVAILEFTAIGVDAAAYQMQAGVIFVAGLAAQLIPLGRHLAVGDVEVKKEKDRDMTLS